MKKTLLLLLALLLAVSLFAIPEGPEPGPGDPCVDWCWNFCVCGQIEPGEECYGPPTPADQACYEGCIGTC